MQHIVACCLLADKSANKGLHHRSRCPKQVGTHVLRQSHYAQQRLSRFNPETTSTISPKCLFLWQHACYINLAIARQISLPCCFSDTGPVETRYWKHSVVESSRTTMRGFSGASAAPTFCPRACADIMASSTRYLSSEPVFDAGWRRGIS